MCDIHLDGEFNELIPQGEANIQRFRIWYARN